MIERRDFDVRPKRRYVRFVVILAAAIALAFPLYGWWIGPYDAGSGEIESVVIPSGYSSADIASSLADGDMIRSARAFRFYVWWHGKDHSLRSGTYRLSRSMDVPEIVGILTGDAAGEVSVTIPEGFTVADIDRLMTAKGFAATGAILACVKTCDFSAFTFLPPAADGPGGRIEGYAYPDTYFIGGEAGDPQALLSRLLSTFETKVVDGLSTEIAASGKSLHDIVTMASLVEEEAAGDDERAIIAGILWKRLDEGIILGVDAAVRYAVGKRTEPLTSADLRVDSPYNLRARRGLPPGPIANPGLASIEAALKPEASPYYYYLHGTDGEIRYAVTNDEHNANKAKYLR